LTQKITYVCVSGLASKVEAFIMMVRIVLHSIHSFFIDIEQMVICCPIHISIINHVLYLVNYCKFSLVILSLQWIRAAFGEFL